MVAAGDESQVIATTHAVVSLLGRLCRLSFICGIEFALGVKVLLVLGIDAEIAVFKHKVVSTQLARLEIYNSLRG